MLILYLVQPHAMLEHITQPSFCTVLAPRHSLNGLPKSLHLPVYSDHLRAFPVFPGLGSLHLKSAAT